MNTKADMQPMPSYADQPPPLWLTAWHQAAELHILGWQIWLGWTLAAVRMHKHLAAEHLAFLARHQPHRRWHAAPPSGADLTDHYGHRAQDVDAERI